MLRGTELITGVAIMEKINLSEKLSLTEGYWKPTIIGELNGQHVKLSKFKGPFTWHHHDNEDELFLVMKGRFCMQYREDNDPAKEREVWLEQGEMIIVPRGADHRPISTEETHVLLFEPATTLNTGNVQNEFTVQAPRKI
jgi:mannose-6-phosphate isomerase-like protein (cupin superfamily)